ncbi:hypothetical protein G4B88_030269 [Cannabis sativa]|uniref:Ubiquitin-like protease family profile domain-containing protein n=1 Tax=Cannabis sativa TaxID=3483 RepID=A0A7J6GEU7_CANSA|nr:hypothetical protein G4B88_030269 [Cannabis sativa]
MCYWALAVYNTSIKGVSSSWNLSLITTNVPLFAKSRSRLHYTLDNLIYYTQCITFFLLHHNIFTVAETAASTVLVIRLEWSWLNQVDQSSKFKAQLVCSYASLILLVEIEEKRRSKGMNLHSSKGAVQQCVDRVVMTGSCMGTISGSIEGEADADGDSRASADIGLMENIVINNFGLRVTTRTKNYLSTPEPETRLEAFSGSTRPDYTGWYLPSGPSGPKMRQKSLLALGKGKSPVKLKLRNITPTSVERLSLSLTDFFSGETTPEAVKFKIKGGSKPAGQPGLMGASSSSAHENVSRVEFEEFKKCLSIVVSQQGILMKSVAEMNKKLDILIEPEQSQGGEENIDVDATIASAVKAVENLIGSSTHAPASVETSKKNDLEMVVFQETPILRPQKRDRKKGAVFSVIYLLSTTTNVYCKGKDTIFPPFRFGVEDISNKMWFHNLAYPNCFLTNYVNFKGLCNEAKFSTMEPFPIVAVDDLPEQVTADCGVFVASFAEYFIDGKPIPSSDFHVEIHRDRLAVLFYQYAMKKQTENIESESEAPPSLPKKSFFLCFFEYKYSFQY